MVMKDMKASKRSPWLQKVHRLAGLDPVLLISVILLNLAGLLSISSITDVSGNSTLFFKQAAGSLAGIAVMDPQTFNDPDEAIPRLPHPGFLWPGAYARVFLCGLSG